MSGHSKNDIKIDMDERCYGSRTTFEKTRISRPRSIYEEEIMKLVSFLPHKTD